MGIRLSSPLRVSPLTELPRFLAAAKATLTPEQLEGARKLVADSADAAWAARVQPPFPEADVCNEFRERPPPSGSPPKFTWDFEPLPDGGALTCMDARTQAQALALFVADVRMEQIFGPREQTARGERNGSAPWSAPHQRNMRTDD